MSDRAEYPNTISALKRKRAEIAGLIADLEKRLDGLHTDLLHLDHTLRLFDPTIEPRHIRGKRPRTSSAGYFEHGEITRWIYDGLRERQILSAIDLAETAMAAKNLPVDDRHIRARFRTRFEVRLSQLAEKGTVERVGGGKGVRWRLAGEA